MIRNKLISLPESSSPLDYTILTPLVSFISLCASFEADLIHSLGTLTLTDIDYVSIMKSSVCPTPKRGGLTDQSDPKHARVHVNLTPQDPYIGCIGSRNIIYKVTHTRQDRRSHLMRVTSTSALP